MTRGNGWTPLDQGDNNDEEGDAPTTAAPSTSALARAWSAAAPPVIPTSRHHDDEDGEAQGGHAGHGHSHGGHGHSHGLAQLRSLLALRGSQGALRRLLGLLRLETSLVLAGGLALAVATAINVLMPYSLGTLLQTALGAGDFAVVARITVLFFFLYLFGASMTTTRVYCFTVAGERIVRKLRLRLFRSLVAQPIAFFDNNRAGELTNRLSADCELIRTTLTTTLVVMIRFGLQIVGGAVFLFYLSWSLTLVMLSIVPVLGVVAQIYSRTARKYGHRLQSALADNAAMAGEVLLGIRHVRLFDQERYETGRFDTMLGNAYVRGRQLGFASAIFMGIAEFGAYIAVLVVIVFGTYLVINGELSIDFITSYTLYAVYVAHALGAISNQAAELARAAGASQRVFDLLDRVESQNKSTESSVTTQRLPTDNKLRGNIHFQNVAFAYPTEGPKAPPDVLRDLTFKITSGQSIGIVGPSGAGKSSILQLLPRLYDPTRGSVSIDGISSTQYDAHYLRRQIGYVSQEPILFHGTVRENIMYGRLDATDEEVVEAAKAALIHDVIMSLPLGYDSPVGDRGSGLSGGQRQRIAIARVFLKDAPIVLMDEPTSALDAANEALVVQAIQRLFENRTVLIVTHRSDLLRIVNSILVINDGQVEAFGDEQTVAATSATYKRLFVST